MTKIINPCILFFFFVIMVGCSGGSTPVAPGGSPNNEGIVQNPSGQSHDENVFELPQIADGNLPEQSKEPFINHTLDFALTGDTFQTISTLGGYELTLDIETMSAELTSMRTGSIGESFLVNGAAFFTIQPCADCLKIDSLEITTDNLLKVNFLVSHPFPKGNILKPPSASNRLDLDVFDLALLVVPSDETLESFPLTGTEASLALCEYADGYTRELGDLTETDVAFPFFLVVDDSESGKNTFNRFDMGTQNLPFSAYFSGGGIFNLFLTMGYGASARKMTRLTPSYYLPEFNRKNTWKIDIITPEKPSAPALGNTWDDVDHSTPFDVMVLVYDWQHNATVAPTYPDPDHKDWIYKSSKVKSVSVEVPGMTSELHSSDIPITGTGTPQNPLVYKVSFANENGLPAGVYHGIAKVLDEREPPGTPSPGQTDSLVTTKDGENLEWGTIPEYATYQVFNATVLVGRTITVDYPNGGEIWTVRLPYTVTWSYTGPIENVNIELSLDDSMSNMIPIATNVPNTGSFDIISLGIHPTETARIKVTCAELPSIFDTSDGLFTIICPTPSAPTNVTATDGSYWDRVEISWDAVQYATGYNLYRNGNPIQEDLQDTSYTDTNVIMGTVYYYQVETIDDCGVSEKAPASPGEAGHACVLPSTPTNFTASDGTYTDRVTLNWQSATGALTYNIYRDDVLLQSNVVGTSWFYRKSRTSLGFQVETLPHF